MHPYGSFQTLLTLQNQLVTDTDKRTTHAHGTAAVVPQGTRYSSFIFRLMLAIVISKCYFICSYTNANQPCVYWPRLRYQCIPRMEVRILVSQHINAV